MTSAISRATTRPTAARTTTPTKKLTKLTAEQLNNRTRLAVKPGDKIVVTLDGQGHGGGYRWAIKSPIGEPTSEFKAHSTRSIGGGGSNTFTFTVPANAKKGAAVIAFENKRPWEPNGQVIAKHKLNLTIVK